MAYTEAGKRAVAKYVAKAYDDIKVRVPKGQKGVIQARADELGKSVNAYIQDLIDKDLKTENP